MGSAIDPAATGDGGVEEGALAAALTLTTEVLSDESGSRTGAITLLAADALMSYAFEAAAMAPSGIDDLAADAIRRVSAIAVRRQ